MAFASWKRGMAVVGSVSMIALVLAGCGGTNGFKGTTGSGPSKEGGTINIDSIGTIKDLDPAHAYDTSSEEIVQQVYDRLVTYQGTGATIVGMDAKSWEVSPNGKVYTFHLRPGLKFSNGDTVTAQSFVDEFDRVLSKSINSPAEGFLDPILQGSHAYYEGKAKSVSGLKAVNANTLQITLTAPEAFFVQVLAMPFFAPVDMKFIDKVGNTAFDSKETMGNGPFVLSSVSPSTYVLTKNPLYWEKDAQGNRLPYLNQVNININANTELDALNFQKGQTAFMGMMTNGVPSTAWPQFISTPSLKKTIMQLPSNATYYIGFNNKIKPFNNVLVRQAMEYAINRTRIAKLLDNRVQVANQPLPPGIDGYEKNLPADLQYHYNPAKAKQLLKQAGFPNGFTTTLYSSNDTDTVKIDNAVQSDLAAVGVKLNIVQEAWGTFLANNEKGTVTPVFQLAWLQDFPDASDFLNTLFNTNQQPANNSTMYSNKQVDALLNKAQTSTDSAARSKMYAEVTNQIMKDADWDPMYYGLFQYAVQPWVHGFYINQTLMDPIQDVWIDASHR